MIFLIKEQLELGEKNKFFPIAKAIERKQEKLHKYISLDSLYMEQDVFQFDDQFTEAEEIFFPFQKHKRIKIILSWVV